MGGHKRVSRRHFGAGSFSRRHDQGFQALTGALVMGTAIGVLTLHHFGFGPALLVALVAAGICAMVRTGAAAGSFVVLAALFAGVIATPYLNESADANGVQFVTPVTQTNSPETFELYVLEGPPEPLWDANAHSLPLMPDPERPRVLEL
jgi:hypothetical protein